MFFLLSLDSIPNGVIICIEGDVSTFAFRATRRTFLEPPYTLDTARVRRPFFDRGTPIRESLPPDMMTMATRSWEGIEWHSI